MNRHLWLSVACLVVAVGCSNMPPSYVDGGSGGGSGGGAGGGSGGGSELDGGGGGDAGETDAGDVDSGIPDAGDSDGGSVDGGASDGGDGGLPGCEMRDGGACHTPIGLSGLCSMGACGNCATPTDDGACTSAYGSTSARYLCIGGECAPGNCRADGDCLGAGKPGQICGLGANNQCAPCVNDTQCKGSSYGAGSICSSGACVPGSCTTVGTACTLNPADFCCGTPLTCVAGNCCGDSNCADAGVGAICRNNACTTCSAVTNNTYYVDPVLGLDTSSTGSTACPFKTLTRATQYIVGIAIVAGGPANVPQGTKILLRASVPAVNGENFPISVPQNVTISSELAAMPKTVAIKAGANGFQLLAPSSGLSALLIDGQGTGLTGIRVSMGQISGTNFTPSKDSTQISDVTISGMRNDGIDVQSGGVLIRAGVVSQLNGTNPTNNGLGSGLHVEGGVAVVTVNTGETTTSFSQNQADGIFVQGNGQLTLTGKPDLTAYPANMNPPAIASGAGTVVANQNKLANLAVAGQGNNLPVTSIDGLVTWKGMGNGMNLLAGSNVVVRNSVSTGNASSGVQITPSGFGSFASISLSGGMFGRNIFQTAMPATANAAGICIGNFLNSMQTLNAKGNFFGAKDCVIVSLPKTPLSVSKTGCTGNVDVGIEPTFGSQMQTNIHVTLDNCQSI